MTAIENLTAAVAELAVKGTARSAFIAAQNQATLDYENARNWVNTCKAALEDELGKIDQAAALPPKEEVTA